MEKEEFLKHLQPQVTSQMLKTGVACNVAYALKDEEEIIGVANIVVTNKDEWMLAIHTKDGGHAISSTSRGFVKDDKVKATLKSMGYSDVEAVIRFDANRTAQLAMPWKGNYTFIVNEEKTRGVFIMQVLPKKV